MASYYAMTNGKYRAQLCVGGVRRSKVFRTKREAAAWAESLSFSMKAAEDELEFLMSRYGKSRTESVISPTIIINSLTPCYSSHGVYLLFNDGMCVYVGQSRNVLKRICSHAEKGRSFTHYYIVPCLESELNKTELAYIEAFLPAKNRDGITVSA